MPWPFLNTEPYGRMREELDRNILGEAARIAMIPAPWERTGLLRALTEIGLEFRGTPPWPHFNEGCWSVTEVMQR